jgi:hypothetical protein
LGPSSFPAGRRGAERLRRLSQCRVPRFTPKLRDRPDLQRASQQDNVELGCRGKGGFPRSKIERNSGLSMGAINYRPEGFKPMKRLLPAKVGLTKLIAFLR